MATRYEIALVNFAYNAELTPAQAVALPAIVEKCADVAGMGRLTFALLIADDTTTDLSQYVVSICKRPEIEAVGREVIA